MSEDRRAARNQVDAERDPDRRGRRGRDDGKRSNRKKNEIVVENYDIGEGCTELMESCINEKLFPVFVYTLSCMLMGVTAAGAFRWPSLLLYLYVILAPIFVICRVAYYLTHKKHYLLTDFSFLLQMNTFIFLWAGPKSLEYTQITFGLALGPPLWISTVFPRMFCLVPHSADRMISLFFIFLPALIMFNVKHQSALASDWWYDDFLQDTNKPTLNDNFAFVFAIPLGIFLTHYAFYSLFVHVLLTPEKEEYTTSFYQVMEDEEAYLCRFIKFVADSFPGQYLCYSLLYLVFGTTSLLLSVVYWESQVGAIIFLCLQTIAPFWNGAEFYIHTMGPGNFHIDSY